MPTRATRPKGRIPCRLALAVGPPDECVKRILLPWAVWVATAFGEEGAHLFGRVIGLITKALGGLDGGVDIWVLGVVYDVGRSGVEKLLHHLHDLIDGLHGADIVLRRENGEQLHIGTEEVNLRSAELTPIHAVAFGTFE